MSILNEVTKCENPDLHPTNHPRDCICDHCWHEEQEGRVMFGRKMTSKEVWKRRMSKAPRREVNNNG